MYIVIMFSFCKQGDVVLWNRL